MRIRTIKPEFYASFSIAKLSESAVILAIGLLNHSCDRGFFEADPRLIKAAIYPLREPSVSTHCMLQELVDIGYIELRDAPDGRLVGQVVNFGSHQRINRPSEKISKAQDGFAKGQAAKQFQKNKPQSELLLTECSVSPYAASVEPSQKRPAGTGNREQREQGSDIAPATQARSRNELFDVLVEVTGLNPNTAGGEIGKALKDIKELMPNVTPDEIRRRTANYKLHYRDAGLSANALAKWWGLCGEPPETHKSTCR